MTSLEKETRTIERLEFLLLDTQNSDSEAFIRAFKRAYPLLGIDGKKRLIKCLMERVDLFLATGLPSELALAA